MVWIMFLTAWYLLGLVSSFSLSIFFDKRLTVSDLLFNITIGAALGVVPFVVLVEKCFKGMGLNRKWNKFLNKRIF